MAIEILPEDIKALILQKLKNVMAKNPQLDPAKCFQTSPASEIEITQLSGGYMNYVVRVRYGPEAQKQSIVVKYAAPYVRVSGPGVYPAPLRRVEVEYNCIVKFEEIYPGAGPNPYFMDKDAGMFLMEDLQGYQVMKQAMKNGEVDKVAYQKLGKILAKIHSSTHVSNLSKEEFEKLKNDFENEEMLKLNVDYVYVKPLDPKDKDAHLEPEVRPKYERIIKNAEYKGIVDKFAQIYSTKQDCLIHGDLHNGSILIKKGDPRLFDNEFSCIGPMSYDMAMLIGHSLISYHYHMLTPEDNDSHRQVSYKILEACNSLVQTYLENLQIKVSDKEQYLADFFSEMAGLMGIDLATRTMGAARSEDIAGWGSAELEVLETGYRLASAHMRIHDISRLLNIALMLT